MLMRDSGEIVVAVGSATDVDVRRLMKDFRSVLDQARLTGDILGTGTIEEVMADSEKLTLLVRVIAQGQLIFGLAIGPGANIGKARHYLRLRSSDVVRAISLDT